MLTWMLLGCWEGEPAPVVTTPTERPPDITPGRRSPVEALAGRWEAVSLREGGPVREECESVAFVEFRGDGDGGWEMIAQAGAEAELLILPVLQAEPQEQGLLIELGAAIPGEPGQSMRVQWVEADKIATFGPPLGERPYVTKAHRDSIPTVPCGE
jgi:hypothetical protein